MDQQTTRQHRVRRAAARHDLALVKSRSRMPEAPDYGTYGLMDPELNAWVAYDLRDGYGLDLDQVEAWLQRLT